MNLYSEIKPELSYFLKSIENYNEVPFNRKNKRNKISVGYLYKEVCEDFNLRIIPNIKKCLEESDKSNKGKTFKGWWHFLFNKGIRNDSKKMTEEFKETDFVKPSIVKDELYRIMKEMESLGGELGKMKKNEIKHVKTSHKQLGHLNAYEWFKLGIYNLEYFKKIKGKLDKELSEG